MCCKKRTQTPKYLPEVTGAKEWFASTALRHLLQSAIASSTSTVARPSALLATDKYRSVNFDRIAYIPGFVFYGKEKSSRIGK